MHHFRFVALLFAAVVASPIVLGPSDAGAQQECKTVAYIGNHPRGKSALGWSEQAQGIAHDDQNWFISRNLNFYKIPATHDLDFPVSCDTVPCSDIRDTPFASYDHLGGLDHHRGFVCIGVHKIGHPEVPSILAFFGADDMELKSTFRVPTIESEVCEADGTGCVNSVAFCAIDSAGYVYTDGTPRNGNRLQKFKINWDEMEAGADARILDRFVVELFDEEGAPLEIFSTQGADFSDSGVLFLSNGNPKKDCDCGIHVFDMRLGDEASSPLCSTGDWDCRGTRLERSHNGHSTETPFNFEYNPGTFGGQEPEDVTWWDLTQRGAPPVPGTTTANVEVASSQLHALMLDNELFEDRVWIKHYQQCEALEGVVVNPLIAEIDVDVGLLRVFPIEVSNSGDTDLQLEDLQIRPGGSRAFTIVSSPALPVLLSPGSRTTIEVEFVPTVGSTESAVLEITTSDADTPFLEVALFGRGVSHVEQLQDLISLFDLAVAEGQLEGVGRGNSAEGRRDALRDMLEEALRSRESGFVEQSCGQLRAALLHADGAPKPPDFVAGEAAETLAAEIRHLRENLGCKIGQCPMPGWLRPHPPGSGRVRDGEASRANGWREPLKALRRIATSSHACRRRTDRSALDRHTWRPGQYWDRDDRFRAGGSGLGGRGQHLTGGQPSAGAWTY